MEAKMAHDSEFKFKVGVRRNKLLAHWAADALGIEDLEAYAQKVIKSDFEEAGTDDVVRCVMADFNEKGVAMTEDEIRDKMAAFEVEAAEALMNED